MPTRATIVLSVLGLALAACSGGGSKGGTTPAPATPAATTPPSAVASASAATSPAATESALPTPGSGASSVDPAARAAAEAVFHGVVAASCEQATPDASATSCLTPLSAPDTVAGGISAWLVSAPQGGSSYTGVLGRGADGSWKLWFSSQDVIAQVVLPGKMRVCADGQGLNLRASASATADRIASIADNDIVEADKFVLTEPGTPTLSGYGWYHLTTHPDGWAYSKYLTDAAQPNCDARNRAEQGR